MLTAEQQARVVIDLLLTAAGWVVQDVKAADVHAGRGVALREESDLGNEFALKISYRTTSAKPEDLIKAFRTSYYLRIAVTVDMIATGTDIKPVEIVVFMRSVKSRSFFEHMKGCDVRIIKDDDLTAVNPGEHVYKDHFVIVDYVGVGERDEAGSYPMYYRSRVPRRSLRRARERVKAYSQSGRQRAPASTAHWFTVSQTETRMQFRKRPWN